MRFVLSFARAVFILTLCWKEENMCWKEENMLFVLFFACAVFLSLRRMFLPLLSVGTKQAKDKESILFSYRAVTGAVFILCVF